MSRAKNAYRTIYLFAPFKSGQGKGETYHETGNLFKKQESNMHDGPVSISDNKEDALGASLF